MATHELFFIRSPKLANKSKPLLRGLTEYFLTPRPLSERQVNNSDNNLPKDDLYTCMRVFLCFGRLFGIIPISGLFTGNLESISFRSRSFAGLLSISAITLLTVYNLIALFGFFRQRKNDASQIVTNLREFMFGGIGLYVYVYMHQNASKLIDCFHSWRSTRTTFYKEDVPLFRSITLISGILYTLGIIENFGSHWKVIRDTYFALNQTSTTNPTTVGPGKEAAKPTLTENYFSEEYPQYLDFIPYNLAIAIGFYIGDKCAVYAWNFGDIFIALIGRAMYKRFQLHFEDFKERLDSDPSLIYDKEVWNEGVADHESLLKLHAQFKTLLSPLIFVSIFINVYFICINLFFFLVPSEESAVNNIYTALAFTQLLLRIFTACFYCAKVSECAHEIEELLSSCPVSTLTKEVERAEFKLKTTTIGFDGLKCFTITKTFILSVCNVIFTLEIVLLQTSTSVSPGSTTGHNSGGT